MDVYLRIGLLAVAAVILITLFFGNIFRKKRLGPDNVPDYLAPTKQEPRLETAQLTFTLEPELPPTPPATTIPTKQPEKKASLGIPKEVLMLCLAAKSGVKFESYNLLQTIAAAGFQFGDMNIFHYYQQSPVGKFTLFSLASATKSGDFDLDHIGDFSCSGLILFMDLAQVPDPVYAFREMLKTAELLADELDGELLADTQTPWNEKAFRLYQQRIARVGTIDSV